jgi:ABC-type sugar transport system ATPase subunit
VLSVKDLVIRIAGVNVVDGVSLMASEGRILAIVGESGCGKSLTALSILQLLPGAAQIAGGQIHLEGAELTAMDEAELRQVRGNRASIIFQEPVASLNPLMRVGAQVEEALRIHRGLSGEQARQQAIAMLAYGTATVKAVDKIVGPGNAYVTSAKKQVFGIVGIDMIAGPSEVTIVSDGASDPDWVAADLLAQAEHDASSQSILITDDTDFADRVMAAVGRQLAGLPRQETARQSWHDNGAVIVVAALEDTRSRKLSSSFAWAPRSG